MLFLVEIDYARTGPPPTPESGKFFIETFILPTLTKAEELSASCGPALFGIRFHDELL